MLRIHSRLAVPKVNDVEQRPLALGAMPVAASLRTLSRSSSSKPQMGLSKAAEGRTPVRKIFPTFLPTAAPMVSKRFLLASAALRRDAFLDFLLSLRRPAPATLSTPSKAWVSRTGS